VYWVAISLSRRSALGVGAVEDAAHGGQLLFPLLETLVADAQFAGDLLDGFAALEPELHGVAFEVFVVSLVFAFVLVSVFMGRRVFSSHQHPTLVHQIGARPA